MLEEREAKRQEVSAKKQAEQQKRDDEEVRIANMPEWKRQIIMKKRGEL